MKIEEDTFEQQGPTTLKDDTDPGAGDGVTSREQRPVAGHTHISDVTDHKKAATRTVKVSVLSDGNSKSVLKNTKNCCTDVANAVGSKGNDRAVEIQTLITEIMEKRKDEDVDKRVPHHETAPRETRPTSSSSPVKITEELENNEDDTVPSRPLQVTLATEREDPGVTVAQDEDKLPHVDGPRDSDVHEEGGHDDDDGGDNADGDGGGHNDENDDDDSLVLFDDCVACVTDGESHYITTHEIQLAELSDQEEDGQGCDVKAGSLEVDSQVYSFVDYSPFVADVGATAGGGLRARPDNGTLHLERDLLSSDGSLSKTKHCGGTAPKGQVQHLSIKTTSRAINDPSSDIQEKQNKTHHQHIACARPGDTRGRMFRGADGKTKTVRGGAKCFIAAPGRLHFGRALKGRDANCFSSSGASSALSEPDDADKEVRNLTGRAFKSLAYPYLGAINVSSSSESSAASDHVLGLNRWSAFVDLKYGKLGMDQLVGRQNPPSSFGVAHAMDHMHNNTKGYKGVIKMPANKLFTLNNNNSSAQKIELLGKFGHAHGGIFTLTETLNFRCNVESRMPGGERRAKFAQSALGSRSADEVTDTSPGRQSSARTSRIPCSAGATMDDTHKKSMFASSILKNVISKKMQFEEERKMERGEICERQRSASSAGFAPVPESSARKGRELQRQSSRFSEGSSDNTIVGLDELGDMVDTGSCDTISDCPRQEEPISPAPETHLESTNEAGMDPSKRGVFEAAKSTLLRSQNSAFRSWRDGELEFQTEHKNHKTPEQASFYDRPDVSGPCSDPDHKLKKMSHLFVPTIQIMPNEWEVGKQQPIMNYSVCASAVEGERGGMELLSDTRYDADPRRIKTSKSPEIKINLMAKDNKKEPFGASNLRPHNVGGNMPGLTRPDDSRCQALATVLKGESSDKVPHFMVRDIRDNKGKFQTPIHQVRDVRKLMKSSYHFVSLDNNDTKSNLTTGGDCNADQKKHGLYRNQASVSPIVIKCQSVNTNSNGKQSGNLIDSFKCGVSEEPQCEADRFDRLSPEGAKAGSSLFQKRPETPNQGDPSEGSLGLNLDTNSASSCRQEKPSDPADTKPESTTKNQSAFRKLQAAVKTMEQLYVFDRNEWKRKSEPRPLTAPGGEEPDHRRPAPNKDPQAGRGPRPNAPSAVRDSPRTLDSAFPRGEERDLPKPFQHPASHELGFKPIPAQGTPAKNVYDFSAFGSKKTPENPGSVRAFLQNPPPRTPGAPQGFVPKSPRLPVSVRISRAEAKEKHQGPPHARADPHSYLSIPLQAQTHAGKRVNSVPPSTSQDKPVYTVSTAAGPGPRPRTPPKQFVPRAAAEPAAARSPEVPAPPAPPAPLYSPFPLGMVPAQQQVFCFSPAAMSPGPALLEPFQQPTQRKMLLDPTTGSYYLVDTPVQPATKRLYDPETGQYVDFPMPQPPMTPMTSMTSMSPMTPMTSMTPIPMSMPPMISPPGAYGHAYMFYPGFMPGVIPGRSLSQAPQMMCVSQQAEGAAAGGGPGAYAESPYYLATGPSPQQQRRAPAGPMGGKPPPVISITAQQGAPRIVAPPSFDGTTMSFVVEHR